MKLLISFLFATAILVMPQCLNAETYYVDQNHPLASDNNPGTEEEPFETVQKGINTTASGDTVFIKIGHYDLTGFSKDLDHPLCLLGEQKDSVIFDSIGTFNIIGGPDSCIFTLKNVKFTNYTGSIFNLTVAAGDTLEGIYISDCIFDKVELTSKTRLFLARYDVSPDGVLKNIHISNCDFLGLKAPGVKYIYIYEGIISDISITNNNFYDLISNSDTRGAIAINVGTNSNLAVNRDILISGNFMDTIFAGTDGEIETHGILAYGDRIRIIDNTVMEMNPGNDHEAIYMKGSYSLIDNNVLINCTSHQGAIAIKGTGDSFFDTISNNRLQSTQDGRGIYTAGPESIVMEYNYVKNTCDTSTDGLYIYGANGSACYMKNNYSQTARNAAYMHNVGGGWITGNTLISYNGKTVALSGTSSGINVTGNMELLGWPPDPPTAMASADVITGVAPLTVNFSSGGSVDPNGVISSFDWNFHDGNTSSEPGPAHTFTEARTHTVTLIVTDADGFKDMAYVVIRVEKEKEEIPVALTEAVEDEDLALCVYPNPFHSSTNIAFELFSNSRVLLNVFDLSGNLVKTIFDGSLPAGRKQINWSAPELPAGVYLIQCRVGNRVSTKRVVLISSK